jgi:uncharacterized protein YhdP
LPRPPVQQAALPRSPTFTNLSDSRLRAERLKGHRLNNVVVGGTREKRLARQHERRRANGYVDWASQPSALAGRRPFVRALETGSTSKAGAASTWRLLNEQPASIPALDIVVDDVELRGPGLGRDRGGCRQPAP